MAEEEAEADDDFRIERLELKIRSSHATLSIVDDLNSFSETLGHAVLASASNHASHDDLKHLGSKVFSKKKQLIILIKLCNMILLSIRYMKIVIPVSCII